MRAAAWAIVRALVSEPWTVRPADGDARRRRHARTTTGSKSAGGANRRDRNGHACPRIMRNESREFPEPIAISCRMREKQSVGARLPARLARPLYGILLAQRQTGGARDAAICAAAGLGGFPARTAGHTRLRAIRRPRKRFRCFAAERPRRSSCRTALDQKNELDRTCAMLRALDAVVSAPTAVSWLAAGAGVPTAKFSTTRAGQASARSYEPFAPSCALHDAEANAAIGPTRFRARRLAAGSNRSTNTGRSPAFASVRARSAAMRAAPSPSIVDQARRAHLAAARSDRRADAHTAWRSRHRRRAARRPATTHAGRLERRRRQGMIVVRHR